MQARTSVHSETFGAEFGDEVIYLREKRACIESEQPASMPRGGQKKASHTHRLLEGDGPGEPMTKAVTKLWAQEEEARRAFDEYRDASNQRRVAWDPLLFYVRVAKSRK